ncbi:hypothetical protein XH87_00055 [Bradyrhizobium sp. CCBAU 53415]|nr:hypothetical protein [Bradyrhizobium sp. CCBAU 53415]
MRNKITQRETDTVTSFEVRSTPDRRIRTSEVKSFVDAKLGGTLRIADTTIEEMPLFAIHIFDVAGDDLV